MNPVALRLVAHAISPIEGFKEESITAQLIVEAAEIAKRNKVFLAFCEGLMKLGLKVPESVRVNWEREARRKEAYEKALANIAEAAKRRDVKFMVFKSIKPFTYVGDDLDLLIPNKRDFNDFVDLMKSLGYASMGGGPPEETFVKYVDGVKIMVDVHRSLSASYVPYVDAHSVWNRRMEIKYCDVNVCVPSIYDEMLILAGHSLLKEFRINLAEFYHGLFLIPKMDIEKLCKFAKVEGMSYALKIFIYVMGCLYRLLYERDLAYASFNLLIESRFLKVANKVIENDFRRNATIPHYYAFFLPTLGYLDKLRSSIVSGGKEPLSFLKAPFTSKEGVNVLWKYITKPTA